MCLDIVSTRKRSRLGLVSDTRGSRLGLVSDSLANVSVSSRSRSRELRSRSWSLSRPRRSWAHPYHSLILSRVDYTATAFLRCHKQCCETTSICPQRGCQAYLSRTCNPVREVDSRALLQSTVRGDLTVL